MMPESGAKIPSPHPDANLKRADRTTVLERAQLLKSIEGDSSFDQISTLAARTLRVPLALVSMVTGDQQFFKGMHGTLPEPFHTERATPIRYSFCQHVTATGQSLVISDAREHPLVLHNPSVKELTVIAYLGVPLTTASGHVLGSFCVIDHEPRQWTAEEIEVLRGLAALAMVEIELRLSRSQLQGKLAAVEANQRQLDEHTRLLVHDLRTPLNSLLLGLETLPLLGSLNPDQTEALQVATRGGETLVRLVDDLLDAHATEFYGARSLEITPGLNPSVLMATAIGQVAAMAAHGDLTLSIEPDGIAERDGAHPPEFAGDSDKLVRALVNLLSNAVKFTPRGGRVTLVARPGENSHGTPTMTFVVRDTGPGIAPENLERIFERYVRLSPGGGGSHSQRSSGLGLSFVKTVAEAHGGRVTVESKLGEGSVFSLEVPCSPATPSFSS
jgi:signal transduction histidine kinase